MAIPGRHAADLEAILAKRHDNGGWRCNRKRLGVSPDTHNSNPWVTLATLDAFQFTRRLNHDARLHQAVGSLLDHWDARRPLGPCAFGIGTIFNTTEYPFLRYNLFFYVYVLSFYDIAKKDARFQAAWSALGSKLKDGQVVIENPNRKLAQLSFCRQGEPSALASRRIRKIEKNFFPD